MSGPATESASACMLCMRCLRTYADRRTCPVHPGEPLLDVRDAAILFRLAEEDERLSRRSQNRGLALGALAGVALSLSPGVVALLWKESLDLFLGGIFLLEVLVLVGVLAGARIARRRYRPR